MFEKMIAQQTAKKAVINKRYSSISRTEAVAIPNFTGIPDCRAATETDA